MTWWNVSGLTPIAAWDARGFEKVSSDIRLIDRIGSNHATGFGWKTRTNEFIGVNGNGLPTLLASTITYPVNYVVAVFARHDGNRTFFTTGQPGATAYYYMHRPGSSVWTGIGAGINTQISIGASLLGEDAFTAIAVTPSGGRLFARTTLYPTVIPMDRIGPQSMNLIGWPGTHNENLRSTEILFGAGVWAGTADQTQLQTLAAQLRNYLREPVYSRACSNSYNPLRFNRPVSQLSTRISGFERLKKRATFFGNLTITGMVIEDGLPACKEVRVYERRTHICRGSAWSDPVTGNYAFTDLDEKLPYYVLSFDDKGARPAQIRDRIVAAPG